MYYTDRYMDSITLDQMVPVSTLQRDYNEVIGRAEKSKDSIVLVRHSKPVVRLISEKVYKQLFKFKRMYEEEKLLRIVEEGQREYRERKTISIATDDISSMKKLIGL